MSQELKKLKQTLNPLSAKITIINNNSELLKLAKLLKEDNGVLAMDIETSGLDYKSGALTIGYSFTFDNLDSYYVIIREYKDNKLQELETLEPSKKIFNYLKNKKLIFHNAVFDVNFLYDEFNIELIDAIHSDTILQAHTLDSTQKLGLKNLGSKFWPGANQSQLELEEAVKAAGGKWLKKNKEIYKAPGNIIAKYGAMDTAITMALFKFQDYLLEKEKLYSLFYEDEVIPLYKLVTIPMNRYGLKVDEKQLSKVKEDVITNLTNLETKLYNNFSGIVPPFAKELNLNSNEHLSWLLFYYYKEIPLKLTGKGESEAKSIYGKKPRTKSEMQEFKAICDRKNYPFRKYCSTDAGQLRLFAKKYEWVTWILEMKKEKKILSTYIESLESKIIDSHIYPQFLQFGTSTGRYSSRGPNFQNLPRKDTRIKSCISSREGKVFIGADYDQLEPRILSHITKDPIFINAFQTGEDFYSVAAQNTFGLDINEYSADPNNPKFLKITGPEYRDMAKIFSLASSYNTSARKMKKTIQDILNIDYPLEKVQTMINNYFDIFPSIPDYMNKMKELAIKYNMCRNIFGRRRILHKCKDMAMQGSNTYEFKHLMNIACNYPIQSSAAGIINRAAIELAKQLKNNPKWDAYIALNIHDELVVECREEYSKEVANLMKDCMENTYKLRVPLNADPVIGRNLSECK